MHPYDMASVIRSRGKEGSMEIKWGTLYTVVESLERHGFITAIQTVREGRRPERTVYAATDAGRTELRDWLRELIGAPRKEFRRFEAGLSLLGCLGPDESVDLLTQRLGALDSQIAELRTTLPRVAKEIPRLFLIEHEYELTLLEAEATWVRSLIGEISDGSLPGVAQWRTFSETGRVPPEWAEAERRHHGAD